MMLLTTSLLLALGLPTGLQSPLRVTIRAGEKTHGPGQHDHPRFLEDWTRLLQERGCVVQGGLEFPSAETLAATDVLVMYAADGGSIFGEDRAHLEEYLGRGGGIVVIHDAVCGDDPHWFKTVVGGAWEHGHSKWLEGEMGLYFADREHPITRGVANFDMDDEIYWDLHLVPEAHVLANSFHTVFDVKPQMWVYEKDDYRAFVSIQGHQYRSFRNAAWRTLLLRGIAWAGKRDADSLVTADEVAALAYPPGGPRRPEEAADALRLQEGFGIQLVAAEPLVVNPISLDWDPDGRMWVALTPGYPEKEEFSGVPAHDEIVILQDADGDGRMDGSKVFADGLDLVTSLVFHRDGVIVTQAPDIYWLRDTDGDDRADEKITLYSGFGYGDTHAVMSNLRWGMDGWIYGTQGYSGNASRHVIGRDGVDHGHIGNGVFRFKPDGSAIETVVSYGSNTWGLDFTWDGELFYTMANGSHLRHVVVSDAAFAAGRIGEAPSWLDVTDHKEVVPIIPHDRPPYQQIDFVGGFTGAAGSCLYEAGAWPAEFEGNHFVCEPTVNIVHRDLIRPSSVTFGASKERKAEFLAGSDLWFRPVHLRTGPDGALYLLDFYNQAAIHNDTRGPQHGPTNAAIRPDRDHMHGRIWRIQHDAAKRLAKPALGEETGEQLAHELEHPDRWRRMTAQRLLMERDLDPGAQKVLADLVTQDSSPYAKIHALWILSAKGLEADRVAALRTSFYPEVRKNVYLMDRELDRLDLAWRRVSPRSLLDEEPRTRLAALLAWRRHYTAPERELIDLYAALGDDWSRSAVLGIAAERPARFFEAILGAGDEERFLALTGGLIRSVARAADTAEAVRIIGIMSSHGAGAPKSCELALRGLMEMPEGAVPWASPRLQADLRKLLGSDDVRVSIAALPLARRWAGSQLAESEYHAVSERLAAIVEDPDQELELRLACLSSMLAIPEERSNAAQAAARFLDPYFPPEVQLRVIAMLGEAIDVESARVLVASFTALSNQAREQAFDRIVQRPECVGPLLGAIAAGEILPADLGPARIHRLKNHAAEAVARRANELLATTEDRNADALIAELLPAVSRPGDAAHGRELFETNCANCHTFASSGGNVGPELTGMGAHGAQGLLPFILDPNRSVEAAYVEYVAETVDGRLIDGVIARETPESILIRNSSGETEVRRDEIESLRSTGRSPMPTGFEDLGADGLRDILTYLAGDYGAYRVLDLRPLATASTVKGMYDTQRDDKPMRFKSYGVVDVDGVPFEIPDPARFEQNVLVLKGGMVDDWESKTRMPREVDVPVGFALRRLHVLGGIAGWGYPYTQNRGPACKLTWHYADGQDEDVVFTDGDQFADWIGRNDVPGSEFVDLLQERSWGQVRRFHVDPGRPDEVVERITLSSFDNYLAPTFVGLTAQVGEVAEIPRGAAEAAASEETSAPDVLVFGGGSSHDYHRWYDQEDRATLAGAEPERVLAYSQAPEDITAALDVLDVLVLCNNQPLADPDLRAAIFAFVEGGGGLLLLHASTWYNWSDWPEYNAELVGGGARSHEAYAPFAVQLHGDGHPVTEGVPRSFTITDELYRFEPDPAARTEVLAVGTSLSSGEEYPVVWARKHGAGRIVGITLGHDGAAHELPAYRTLLGNALRWVSAGGASRSGASRNGK